jgi:hypothetical protein
LPDGADVAVPFTVTGAASGIGVGVSVTSVQIQIDQGMITPRNDTSGAGDPYDFDLTLDSGPCPTVDQGYTLTIYAWDSGGDLSTKTIGFRRIA